MCREGRGAERRRCFVVDDPHDLEFILEEVGNDEGNLREETKVVISASFGGEQLDRRRSNIERGQELRETHATRLALFLTHQKDIPTLASHTSENRERGSLCQIVAVAENQTY